MKTCWLLALLAPGFLYAEESALLKQPKTQAPYIQVQIDAAVPSGQVPATVLMKTTDDGSDAIVSSPEQMITQAGKTTFRLAMKSVDPKASYFVTIAPLGPGGIPRVLEVDRELTAQLGLSKFCPGGLRVRLKSAGSVNASEWGSIAAWLRGPDPNAIATIRVHPAGQADRDLKIRKVDFGTQTPEQMARDQGASACLLPEQHLPTGSFRTTVAFHGSPRGELEAPLVNDAMEINALEAPASAGSLDPPGNRSLEKNLDASLTFTSEVKPANATASSPCAIGGKRCNVGVFDIRLAPWLNILGGQLAINKWVRLYTPIYLDATVSTAKIDSDTLSQNRIVLGSEYEFRKYSSSAGDSSVQRVVVRVSHASDRDFKQKEYSAAAEYKPIFSPLSRPIRWTWTTDKLVLDSDGLPVKVYKSFGWDVQPLIGGELGRAYSRRNPASAIEPGPTVRRFYWGGSVALGITRHLTLTGTDTFYVRGEDAFRRTRNYLKTEADIPFQGFGGNTANLLFVSYERGALPPFEKPDVNSFVIGYKIQSQGWFGQKR